MKKIMLFIMAILPISSNMVYAETPSFFDFVISLKNATSKDCILKNQQILYGAVKTDTAIPEVLFRGQTMSFAMQKHGLYESEENDLLDGDLLDSLIVLNYECGDNQSITLLSHRTLHSTYIRGRDIRGLILNKNNLNAKFNTHIASFFKYPSKISWIITESE